MRIRVHGSMDGSGELLIKYFVYFNISPRTMEPWRKDKQLVDSAIQYGCTKLMIEKLKPEQDRAVRSFVEGNDVFICLPTGMGNLFFLLFNPIFLITCAVMAPVMELLTHLCCSTAAFNE